MSVAALVTGQAPTAMAAPPVLPAEARAPGFGALLAAAAPVMIDTVPPMPMAIPPVATLLTSTPPAIAQSQAASTLKRTPAPTPVAPATVVAANAVVATPVAVTCVAAAPVALPVANALASAPVAENLSDTMPATAAPRAASPEEAPLSQEPVPAPPFSHPDDANLEATADALDAYKEGDGALVDPGLSGAGYTATAVPLIPPPFQVVTHPGSPAAARLHGGQAVVSEPVRDMTAHAPAIAQRTAAARFMADPATGAAVANMPPALAIPASETVDAIAPSGIAAPQSVAVAVEPSSIAIAGKMRAISAPVMALPFIAASVEPQTVASMPVAGGNIVAVFPASTAPLSPGIVQGAPPYAQPMIAQIAGAAARPAAKGEPRMPLPTEAASPDPAVVIPPPDFRSQPMLAGASKPSETLDTPALATAPDTPVDIGITTARLGAVRIGIEGTAGDLRVSLDLSPTAAAVVVADTGRLLADLAASGIRLQALDVSGGANFQNNNFQNNSFQGGNQPPSNGHSFQPPARGSQAPPATPEPPRPRATDRYA